MCSHFSPTDIERAAQKLMCWSSQSNYLTLLKFVDNYQSILNIKYHTNNRWDTYWIRFHTFMQQLEPNLLPRNLICCVRIQLRYNAYYCCIKKHLPIILLSCYVRNFFKYSQSELSSTCRIENRLHFLYLNVRIFC